ncbi:MAG: EVE domain-containing protein [Chloracidobacterium sp.]|uniref:EVE domain-containing protein n=1 Tax=Chloracidobacterium validum TaxID=2821543 RepID=A0ABX8B9P9_9BACT|nr:EVE domain-containing protein [Chloracidobacterium validum]QUW03394.1 EVE domain-containing protein [Chloracidobacterium validum]
MARYWLLKSEPSVFSIDDLRRAPRQTTSWEGVRNYQARNFLRDDMQVGDQALFYHSNVTPAGIAGIVEVVRAGYPDHTAFDPESRYYDVKSDPARPTWFMVDVRLVRVFPRLITLDELKRTPGLETMLVIRRGMRLSVQPVTESEWHVVLALAGGEPALA